MTGFRLTPATDIYMIRAIMIHALLNDNLDV